MAWPLSLLLKLIFFSWAEITNYIWEAGINYLWDKSHDNDNAPWLQRSVLEISRMKQTVLTVHELNKKKNDLWNADNEYDAGKLNGKRSKIGRWDSKRIWLDSRNFYPILDQIRRFSFLWCWTDRKFDALLKYCFPRNCFHMRWH